MSFSFPRLRRLTLSVSRFGSVPLSPQADSMSLFLSVISTSASQILPDVGFSGGLMDPGNVLSSTRTVRWR